jgi:hypothetical protein
LESSSPPSGAKKPRLLPSAAIDSYRYFVEECQVIIASARFVDAPRHGTLAKAIIGSWL